MKERDYIDREKQEAVFHFDYLGTDYEVIFDRGGVCVMWHQDGDLRDTNIMFSPRDANGELSDNAPTRLFGCQYRPVEGAAKKDYGRRGAQHRWEPPADAVPLLVGMWLAWLRVNKALGEAEERIGRLQEHVRALSGEAFGM